MLSIVGTSSFSDTLWILGKRWLLLLCFVRLLLLAATIMACLGVVNVSLSEDENDVTFGKKVLRYCGAASYAPVWRVRFVILLGASM